MESLRAHPPTDSSLACIVPAFERALLRENLAENTVRSYGWAIADLVRFLQANGVDDLADVDRDLLERWQDQLRERETRMGTHLRSSTRSGASTAARRLIRFAADRDIIDWRLERAIVRVRTVKNDGEPVPPEHLALLRAHYSRPVTRPIDLRDAALFFAFITTGARVTEMLQVKRHDYARPTVVQKGGTDKVLRFPAAVLEKIADWLAVRRDEQPWLWIALGNNVNAIRPLNPDGVLAIWQRVAAQLMIPRFKTHQLRHVFGTELADRDVPMEVIADIMGHHDLRTVKRYVKISERRRQAAVNVAAQLVPASTPRPRAPVFRRRRR